MNDKVLILGGGITGLKAALTLSDFGIKSLVIEKSADLGGKVSKYTKTFPDFDNGKALVNNLVQQATQCPDITVMREASVVHTKTENEVHNIRLSNGQAIDVNAVILTCGFEVFDARNQEEYGYGVYPNVVNAVELEAMLDPDGPSEGQLLRPSDGKPAQKIAIVFCVGSRSKRIGNPYCSRVCCSYSTKQAIEIKERDPEASVTCFYMDIRTYGRGFEEMYQHAQEIGVKYIRGRVSECGVMLNGDIQVRAENTLLGKPVQGLFDLVSLSVGMMPCADAENLATAFNIRRSKDGFFMLHEDGFYPHDTSAKGVFVAGSITGLKPIKDCLLDGVSVGGRVALYLKNMGRINF